MLQDLIASDLRHAGRQILRAPAFSATAIVILALTVATTTTLYSLYSALVLSTLPVPDATRIVVVQPADAKGQNRPLYETMHRELRRLPVFDYLALYSGGGMMFMEARGRQAEGLIEAVTPGFHEAMGLQPIAGRFFGDADYDNPDTKSVILSHTMWQRLFGGDPAAIGDSVTISGVPMTVVGVTPPEFKGFYVDTGFGYSVPLSVLNRYLGTDAKRPIRGLQAVGRLKPGIDVAQANAAVETLWSSLRVNAVPPQLPPAEQRDIAGYRISVSSLASGFSTLRTRYQDPLQVLLMIALSLLVIGCVNLSGLMLARTAAREHQLAILLALGASRARFVRQVMTEAIILSITGAALAVPLSFWGARLLTSAIWRNRERLARPTTPDVGVLAVTAAVAVACGVLIAALPAIRAARKRHLSLRPERTATASLGMGGRILLVAQVALSLMLVAGAGLFSTSLWNLRHLDLGVDGAKLRWTRLFAVPNGYRNQVDAAYYPQLIDAIEALPEVRAVAMAGAFPTFFSAGNLMTRYSVSVAGSSATLSDAWMDSVTPRFFEAAGIDRLAGRDFSWSDTPGAGAVAVINESMRQRLFPAGDAVGQRIQIGTEPQRRSVEIVGVVADAAVGSLRDPHHPVVFRPRMQEQMRAPVLIYRALTDPAAADAAVNKVIASSGHEYARGIYSLQEQINTTLIQERLLAGLSTLFAGMAALLAFVGLWGGLTFDVSQRRREIGIRVALGAERARVVRMIVRSGLQVSAIGAVIGAMLAVPAARVLESLVFGVNTQDPRIPLAAAVFLVVTGVTAGIAPAARAAGIDPATTLRSE